MVKKELTVITTYGSGEYFTIKEIGEICHLSHETISLLIENDIVHPIGKELTFDLKQLRRIKRAMRLQRDFEINMQALALVLELLDELETLRTRTALLEKHLIK